VPAAATSLASNALSSSSSPAHRRIDLGRDRLAVDPILRAANRSHTDESLPNRIAAAERRCRDLGRQRALAHLQHLQLGLELLAALVELDRVASPLVLVALDLHRLCLGGPSSRAARAWRPRRRRP